ncbi:MAG TPA: tripartite tricarboxylate transporter substrate-binding protein [Rhodopila sp.]|jgi:tripartite-type tricarboxylate transporter receptor subunit TctC
MTLPRRDFMTGLSVASSLGSAAVASAGPFVRPKRRMHVLLGAPEGSVADTAARAFMEYLAPRLIGADIALTNIPGDAGRAMLAALGDANPDGTTIGWVVTPTLQARIIDRSEPSLGQRIRLLGQIEREPIAFVSPSKDPANTIQDIIRRASDDADAVPLGTPPAGSSPHLAALRLQVLAQTQLNIVTFPSSAAARQAVLDANVSAAALGLSGVIGDLREGNLSAIGIAARRRFGLLPDTPVLDEGGIPLSAFIRRGIGVPVATPPDVTNPMIDAIHAAATDNAFDDQAEVGGYYAAWADGAAWLTQIQTEQAALAELWETNPWLSSSGG